MENKQSFQNIDNSKLEELLIKSKRGKKESFDLLLKHIRDISYSYFLSKYHLKKIKSIEEVEDLTQNICLIFTEQYKKIETVENWVRRVLFLQFVNWYKKENKYQVFELNELGGAKADSGIDENMSHQRILDCLNKLSDMKKSIIKMKFWGGLKFKDIAEILTKNEAAIKKMYYRTLEELKKICG